MTVAAIVPAAGSGQRLGAEVPKALVEIGGVPLVRHAVDALSCAGVDVVVVAAPAHHVDDLAAAVPGAIVVVGGSTRQESVRRALAAVPDGADIVLVHDAARGLAPASLVAAVIDAVRAGAEAVVPVVPVADTVKAVDAAGVVRGTVDRDGLRAVQTPQGFRRAVLEAAHRAPRSDAATDDAALVEAIGVSVVTVEGSAEAFKLTRPLDLVVASALVEQRRANVV